MLALRLSEELETRLNTVAEATGRSKSKIVRDALEQYLEEREDYLLAAARYEEHLHDPTKAVSFEEVLRELNLDN